MWRGWLCLALIASLLVPPGVCACGAAGRQDCHDDESEGQPGDAADLPHEEHDHAPGCPMVRSQLLPGVLAAHFHLPLGDDDIVTALAPPVVEFALTNGTVVPIAFADPPAHRPLYVILRALLI